MIGFRGYLLLLKTIFQVFKNRCVNNYFDRKRFEKEVVYYRNNWNEIGWGK